jgi:hypothetical protein
MKEFVVKVPIEKLAEYGFSKIRTGEKIGFKKGKIIKREYKYATFPGNVYRIFKLVRFVIDQKFLHKVLGFFIGSYMVLAFTFILVIPAIFSEGERTCQFGTRCSEIWTLSGMYMMFYIVPVFFYIIFILAMRQSAFLNSLKFKPLIINLTGIAETHLQWLSTLKYNDPWTYRNIQGWTDHQEARKHARIRLKQKGMITDEDEYIPWKFKIVDKTKLLEEDKKKEFEQYLKDIWDILLAYEYYEMLKK